MYETMKRDAGIIGRITGGNVAIWFKETQGRAVTTWTDDYETMDAAMEAINLFKHKKGDKNVSDKRATKLHENGMPSWT